MGFLHLLKVSKWYNEFVVYKVGENLGILLLILSAISQQTEAILVKQYVKKHQSRGLFFNAVICIFATLYFFITDFDGFALTKGVLPLGIVNSIMYALGFYMAYLAFLYGPFGLTRLFINFGLIIPVFYGIYFLNEKSTILTYISLALLIFSIYLINTKSKKQDLKQKITLKWIIYVLITVVANALITIIGKEKHIIFGASYNNDFLIISLGGAAIILIVLGIVFERKEFKKTLKYGLIYGMGAGISNGINNLLVLITYNYLSISIVSPIKTGVGMIMNFAVSIFLYKEKFTKRQLISIIIGIISIVLMNL